MTAISIYTFVCCFGDYAVLINAGMTPFQATIFNMLSTATAYIGCLLGLLLLDSGVIKVVEDETLNNGKTLYYVSTAAQHEVLDVFAEDIAQLVDMIVETDGELDLVDGVGAVIELALSKIELSKS